MRNGGVNISLQPVKACHSYHLHSQVHFDSQKSHANSIQLDAHYLIDFLFRSRLAIYIRMYVYRWNTWSNYHWQHHEQNQAAASPCRQSLIGNSKPAFDGVLSVPSTAAAAEFECETCNATCNFYISYIEVESSLETTENWVAFLMIKRVNKWGEWYMTTLWHTVCNCMFFITHWSALKIIIILN